jgi:hypothetical protein
MRVALGMILMAFGLQLAAALPASAATLTNVSWSVSRPIPGDTNVRYSWLFTTATTATLSKVTFTVPTGTAGASLTVADVAGIPAGGTATLAGSTVTYTFTAASVSSGTKSMLALDGFTNTSTSGSYTSAVNTFNTTPASVDGPTNSGAVALNNNTTPVTIIIARSTAFSDNLTGVNFLMDPGLAANADVTQPETLTVKSNAASGYALNVSATALTDTQSNVIPSATSGVAVGVTTAAFPVDKWGYQMTRTGVGTLQGALATAGDYVGYTTAGENAIVSSGPTNVDTITITHRVKIDYARDAGTYSSVITYDVVETY